MVFKLGQPAIAAAKNRRDRTPTFTRGVARYRQRGRYSTYRPGESPPYSTSEGHRESADVAMAQPMTVESACSIGLGLTAGSDPVGVFASEPPPGRGKIFQMKHDLSRQTPSTKSPPQKAPPCFPVLPRLPEAAHLTAQLASSFFT